MIRFNPQIVPDIVKRKGHGWSDDDSHRMALKAHKTKTFVEQRSAARPPGEEANCNVSSRCCVDAAASLSCAVLSEIPSGSREAPAPSRTSAQEALPGGAVCCRVEACRMIICMKASAFERARQAPQESTPWLGRLRTRGPDGQ